jgi:CxxC motif-containing protein
MADQDTQNVQADQISHYLCIGCPLGCRLEVEEDDLGEVVEVRGWSCRKGEKYARQEHVDPRRVIATTVHVQGGIWAKLPVKTSDEIPKDMVIEVVRRARQVTVTAPVKMGDVIVANILGTGVDLVASRDMPAA